MQQHRAEHELAALQVRSLLQAVNSAQPDLGEAYRAAVHAQLTLLRFLTMARGLFDTWVSWVPALAINGDAACSLGHPESAHTPGLSTHR